MGQPLDLLADRLRQDERAPPQYRPQKHHPDLVSVAFGASAHACSGGLIAGRGGNDYVGGGRARARVMSPRAAW